jgi:DNA-binding NtrC family response regulator
MAMMLDYPWPGNVRELANAVEHAIILTKGKLVTPMCLPHNVRSYWENNNEKPIDTGTLEGQRKEIQDALDGAAGNRAEAARILGIDRSTLWRRMHRLGIA